MKRFLFSVFGCLVIASLILTACGGKGSSKVGTAQPTAVPGADCASADFVAELTAEQEEVYRDLLDWADEFGADGIGPVAGPNLPLTGSAGGLILAEASEIDSFLASRVKNGPPCSASAAAEGITNFLDDPHAPRALENFRRALRYLMWYVATQGGGPAEIDRGPLQAAAKMLFDRLPASYALGPVDSFVQRLFLVDFVGRARLVDLLSFLTPPGQAYLTYNSTALDFLRLMAAVFAGS